MRLKLRKIEIDTGRPVVFLHTETARKMNIHVGDRVELRYNDHKIICIVDTTRALIKPDEVTLSDDILKYEKIKEGDILEVNIAAHPISSSLISKKMRGRALTRDEIYIIIKDIVNNALTEAEIAYFVLGVYEKGMNHNETIALTEAIYTTGNILKWKKGTKVADKHCIGGIPGNRTTPIVVSICAAAGVVLPKTSSRAITSAAGTADTIETIARVDFPSSTLQKIVHKTGACLAWGGSLGLAPADDKLIRVERLLNVDPESQLIASILAKKLAVGSKYVMIDIPSGEGAKVDNEKALQLKDNFISIAKHFGLNLKVVITDGSQPIGYGIGPVLEMIDVLKVLKREPGFPMDLEKKALYLSGILLEMVKKARPGKGEQLAASILNSGKALKKFNQIINAQGKIHNGLKLAKYSTDITADNFGKIKSVNNTLMNNLAKILGCPADKGSGIYLHKHNEESFQMGEVLLTIYSESQKKLKEGLDFYNSEKVVTFY